MYCDFINILFVTGTLSTFFPFKSHPGDVPLESPRIVDTLIREFQDVWLGLLDNLALGEIRYQLSVPTFIGPAISGEIGITAAKLTGLTSIHRYEDYQIKKLDEGVEIKMRLMAHDVGLKTGVRVSAMHAPIKLSLTAGVRSVTIECTGTFHRGIIIPLIWCRVEELQELSVFINHYNPIPTLSKWLTSAINQLLYTKLVTNIQEHIKNKLIELFSGKPWSKYISMYCDQLESTLSKIVKLVGLQDCKVVN